MKKYLLAIPLTLLLITSVFALSYMSIRASGGNLDYIGSDTDFKYSKIRLNANYREHNGIVRANGHLRILARTTDNKRIVLILKMVNPNTAEGIYWTKGIRPRKVYFEDITANWQNPNLLDLEGTSSTNPEANFKITGMQVKVLRMR